MAVPKANKDSPTFGRHPGTGAPLVKVVSPSAGVSNQQSQVNAAIGVPASVLGTGINADLLVQGPEA